MSNQIQITGGAKVRNLEGVITGSTGVLSSVPLGGANGVATLDSGGKVPVSQLPSSVVTYLGTWNAATNTPTLANGTGDSGDMYICNVSGTVNFGAGPITFAVGDWVLYGSGTWQKSNGQNGTVTSVAASITGNSVGITGSPITTAGTLAFAFAGNSSQYINGAGNLVTFPTITTSATKLITEVYNETGATLSKGTVVYINGGHGNLPTVTKALATGDATSAQTYGVVQTDITNMNNGYVVVIGSLGDLDTQAYPDGTQLYLSGTTAGAWTSTKQYAPAHLVYVGIVTRSHPTQGVVEIKIQNGYEMDELHNVSAQSPSNNDGLFYNTSTSLWEAKSIASALGYTPANDALVVKLAGTQTITGVKTFSSGLNSDYVGVTGDITMDGSFLLKQVAYGTLQTGYTNLSGQTSGLRVGLYGGFNALLNFSTSGSYTYTFPNATGTIALTSDLSGYVDLTTAQTIGGTKTFSDATKNNGGILLQNGSSSTLAGYMNIGGLTNGVKFTSGGGISNTFTLPSATGYTFTFPSQTGTIALTSDLTGGTVTSVALSAPTGFSVTGSPVTTSGTLALAFASGYSLPTTAKQSNWDDAYTWVAAFPTQTGNNGKFLTTDGSTLSWAANPLGTVTSVAMTVPTGLSVSGSPITTSGTLAVTLTAGYSIPTTAKQTEWDTAYTNRITSATSPLSIASNVISISQASGSVSGYLSSTDWTTFNNKQAAITLTTTGSSGAATLVGATLNIPNYGSALSGYLPLTGGTLTGALNGTSASFSSTVTAVGYSKFWNGTTGLLIGAFSAGAGYGALYSTGVTPSSTNFSFASNGATTIINSTNDLVFSINNSVNALSIASTGAATFSSSVTANATSTFSNASNLSAIFSNGGGVSNYNSIELRGGTAGTAVNWQISKDNTASNALQIAPSSAAGGTTYATPVFTILSSGNVGIGTSSPSAISTYTTLDIRGATGGGIKIGKTSTAAFNIQQDGTDAYFNNTANGSIFLYTNDTERMRIDANGNIGVGVTPNAWSTSNSVRAIQLKGGIFWSYSDFSAYVGVNYYWDGSVRKYITSYYASEYQQVEGKHIWFSAPSGTAGTTATFTETMRITSAGRVGIGQTSPGTALSVAGQTENWQLALTSVTGTAGAVIGSPSANVLAFGDWSGTERMRITSSGNVLIGTSTEATGKLQVNGTIYATGFYESSDIRLKNILATNPSVNVLGIDVIKFTRKDNDTEQIRYGYSAQQVKSILPDVVSGNEYLNVNYLDVHTLKIAQLEQEIKELKAKLN